MLASPSMDAGSLARTRTHVEVKARPNLAGPKIACAELFTLSNDYRMHYFPTSSHFRLIVQLLLHM
jgi:hypothetical protein